ncbi:MAG: metallophosphoesterase [Humidesulfovibrio sp.]|uniref:metallophosphoesterase n=1 Tax=Humidesulfovibrio sp. TaxID=2910988 RepID=UPI0027F5DA98|nr:metallophosphoesterase [Humidesulfovibrio sp.]MDQ7835051.1 metallophosphoesterase [Humidesulfovibrio sp.]
MRFYVIFTIIFMFMLLVVLLQVHRQARQSRRAYVLTLLGGLFVSLFLASTRLMPESWPMSLARPAWWLGYGTFGTVAYLFLYQVILFIAEQASRLVLPFMAPRLRSPQALLAVVVLTVLTVGWGVYEGGAVRVLRHEVRSAKVLRPVRVVALSDLHLGALTIDARLERLVRLVGEQKPDLVLLVGDIVNDHPESLEPQAAILRGMRPSLGMFGVFGNHERYEGDARSAQVFRWAGAELLRGRVVDLPGTGVQLLGVDDPGRAGDVSGVLASEVRSLSGNLDPARLHVLMNHRPHAWREAVQPLGIEVMLSGHTHRGQLSPFYLVVKMFNTFMGGWYEENGMLLGVSAGAGFWGPPMRVLAPPDILVLDLLPEAPAKGS